MCMEHTYVIEFSLAVEPWQADFLNRRLNILCILYNEIQNKLVRHFIDLTQTKEWKKHHFSKNMEQALKACGNTKALEAINKIKEHYFLDHAFYEKGVFDENDEPLPITFTKWGLLGYIEKLAKRSVGSGKSLFDIGINATILGQFSNAVYSSWYRRIYDPECTHVSYKKRNGINSFSSRLINKKTFPGFELDLENKQVKIKTNGRKGQYATFITLPILVNTHNQKSMEYESIALSNGLQNIKVLNIVRRKIRNNYKFFLQLTITGIKPNRNNTLEKGRVAIDLGMTKAVIYTEKGILIKPFLPTSKYYEEQDKILRRINRQLDRSRRSSDPDNFKSDGTVKKGHLTWHPSVVYKSLLSRKADLQRKQAEHRKLQHILLANELLSLGDYFVIEDNKVKEWAARKKEQKKSKKSGKNLSMAGFGKFIGHHAPALFVSILQQKVTALGGSFVKIDTKNRATDYDFINDSFTNHDLSERFITTSDGLRHHRDTLAAFNIYYLNEKKKKIGSYDRESMQKHYDSFCMMEADALNRYNHLLKSL